MTKAELEVAAALLMGGDISRQSLLAVKRLITIALYVSDLCLNEIERRGELEFCDGHPIVPYESDHWVETVLTRRGAVRNRLN